MIQLMKFRFHPQTIVRLPQQAWTWFITRSLLQKAGIIVLVVVAVFVLFPLVRPPAEPMVPTVAVQRSDITQTITETGELMTSGSVTVPSSITGTVTEVNVTNGQSVTKGQELYTVSSTATDAERAKAYADYLSAKTQLDSAQSTQLTLQADMFQKWDTFKELAESDTYTNDDGSPKYDQRAVPEFHIPEKEWLAAEEKYKDQQQVIAQAQAALTSAWLAYQATTDGTVTAPADGRVENLAIVPGQTVSTETSTLVITNAAVTPLIQVAINEYDIASVAVGQQAQISIDALNDDIPATVARVDSIGTEVNDVVIYSVYLEPEELSAQAKPGMTTQVEIIAEEKKDVLTVPNAALKISQGKRSVDVLDPRTRQVTRVPVTTGISDGTRTEIISGLAEGDQVVTTTSETDAEAGGSGLLPPRP